MKVSEYIANHFVELGVTEAFGIPGGVILELLYALDSTDGITPNLSYHEQCAGFAACGYAQASGNLGVAYATRGPGFTNLITAIADAYYDSIPTIFITAHANQCPPESIRVMSDQEMDTCSMVRNITKYAERLDDIMDFKRKFDNACNIALMGRKGPVFLDISVNLLKMELVDTSSEIIEENNYFDKNVVDNLIKEIQSARKPVILLGDGINQSNVALKVCELINAMRIPVLSSRFSHDIACSSPFYYGYVGSHAIRTANFILSKCDLIISLGNRLNFPITSKSFNGIFNHAKLMRYDIDDNEFIREIKNSICYKIDIVELVNALPISEIYGNHEDWVDVCNCLAKELHNKDTNLAVENIVSILKKTSSETLIVNDVGNNEFWVSRACVLSKIQNRVIYSKSFGVLGSGLGKAIGAYYGTHKPILCFLGDQGLQMNIQELQYVFQHNLPIVIVLINNGTSGMIKDKEISGFGYPVHTTVESGFVTPNYVKIMDAYGIPHINKDNVDFKNIKSPLFVEIKIDENLVLEPNLPKEKKCQDLQPALPLNIYEYLNDL